MIEDKEKPWEITCNRFVAFLDIMGFKDMVMREGHDEVYRKLQIVSKTKKAFDEIIKGTLGDAPNPIYITTFSDSIVIFSKDDCKEVYGSFVFLVSSLFAGTIYQKIPIKGACAFGKMSVDTEKRIFVGQPLIDAFLLQEELHYYGIVCHHSYDRYLSEKDGLTEYKKYTKMKSPLDFTVKTKLKAGDITHCNINWFNWIEASDCKDEGWVKKAVLRLSNGVSGTPRKYVDNTLEMYDRYLNTKDPKDDEPNSNI